MKGYKKTNADSNSDPDIILKNVIKNFGSFRAIRGVNLEIEHNISLALLGPNGAGKTTLLKLISGMMKPSSGKVSLFGLEPWKFNKELKMKIGVVSHNSFLYNELTALENLLFYGKIYEIPNLSERVNELLEQVGLLKRKHSPVKSFSRGMKQRLSIARALLNNPELLILDEPTSGLDIVGRKELLNYLMEYKMGRTVLLATHSLEEAKICDNVVIILGGEIAYLAKMGSEVEDRYMELVGGVLSE